MAVEPNVIRDEEVLDRLVAAREQIMVEVRKAIIGQDDVVEQVLLSLFVGGHSIITGVPGLAKTLLVRTVASVLDLSFKRIQFTPDLMPADITGTEIIEEDRATGHRAMQFIRGPLFANIVLADEINRTPPKTQAALLEAMQEGRVTVQGVSYDLPRPFFVLATQNPIEMEGTYPFPEAQLDRFMFNVKIGYLPEEDEVSVVKQTTSPQDLQFDSDVGGRDTCVPAPGAQVPASDTVTRYAVRLVNASRPDFSRSSGLRKQVGDLGWISAGVAVSDSRRQGARDSAWPLQRVLRGCSGSCAARPSSSGAVELSG